MNYTAIMVVPNAEVRKSFLRLLNSKSKGVLSSSKGELLHLKNKFDVYLESKWKDYFKYTSNGNGELVLNTSKEVKFDNIELFRGSNKFYLNNGSATSLAKIKDIDWEKTDSHLSSLYHFRKGQFTNKFGFEPIQKFHLIDYVFDHKNQLWDTTELSQDLLVHFLQNHFNENDYFTFISLTKKEDHAM